MRNLLLPILMLAASSAPPVHAAGPAPGRDLAAGCTGCHAANSNSAIPAIAGRSKESIAAQLKEFKQGKRDATVMSRISKGYTDEQLETIAAYFAAQGPR